MKYLIVLGDGMADKNIPELDNRTPLEYADTPTMDKYSKWSEIGMVRTVPEGMAPGSDTANLSAEALTRIALRLSGLQITPW